MTIKENISEIRKHIPADVKLVCVSKFHSENTILEAYEAGERMFGESRVQEMEAKQKHLPADIQWHFIGHLQTNKVKYLIDYVELIHGIDSLRLLKEVNKQAEKAGRVVKCLLQMHIAQEETKFGFSEGEVVEMVSSGEFAELKNVEIAGLMGMATFTDNEAQVRNEFRKLKHFFDQLKNGFFAEQHIFQELSMGMSDDYRIAIEEGSTLVRIGSAIFGNRAY